MARFTPAGNLDARLNHSGMVPFAPSALMLTHFDRVDDVAGQLAAVREALRFQADLARDADEHEFVATLEQIAEDRADPDTRESLFDAGDPRHFYLGLKRYWSKVAA